MPVADAVVRSNDERASGLSSASDLALALAEPRHPVYLTADASGTRTVSLSQPDNAALLGILPPVYPEWLGDRTFGHVHGTRFPYIAGEMANGIASTRMVAVMAQAGMLGFFGAGGLTPDRVQREVAELRNQLPAHRNWGVNLIHSPNEAGQEDRVAQLLLDAQVPAICASAFTGLTPAVVRCAVAGLSVDATGQVVRRARIFGKISRPETARRFMEPAPSDILAHLLAHGQISETEAQLAARIPIAEDITAEADSGGHTDNRPAGPLLASILRLRDEIGHKFGYAQPIRIGMAGGIGAPDTIAAAFAAGAAYVVTGSINQAAIESGLSADGKALLAQADIADVAMAPAADMFEQGVKLQVLSRGSLFPGRASLLYRLYQTCDGLAGIPADMRARLERDVFQAPIDQIWRDTAQFWEQRDPTELDRASSDPKHQMALVFRWYLGQSSRWAITGDKARRSDYQIWCGPAMGAFNRWTAGSFLASPADRSVTQIGLNLLEGAAVLTRAHQLRTFGVHVPPEMFTFVPRPLT